MRATAFSWTLGAAEEDKGLDPFALRWAVWGRGDFGSFEGRPDGISSYRGETRTGWLGVDAREAPLFWRLRASGRWVAGLAVSRGTSKTDYTLEDETGRIETDLTALWPYGRWTFANGLELRGMLGAGRGEARHTADDGETREKSRLSDVDGLGRSAPSPAAPGRDRSRGAGRREPRQDANRQGQRGRGTGGGRHTRRCMAAQGRRGGLEAHRVRRRVFADAVRGDGGAAATAATA